MEFGVHTGVNCITNSQQPPGHLQFIAVTFIFIG